MGHRVHDFEILDAIEAITPIRYKGSVWRVAPTGRDPTQGWKSKGRWSDGTFQVLYTSLEADTAKTEVHFHLYQKNPVPPSKLQHQLHEISVDSERTLKLLDTDALLAVGLTSEAYFDKNFRSVYERLYPKTQAIGAAAKFLDFDGLQVPSARSNGKNLVLLLDNFAPGQILETLHSEPIDLKNWTTNASP